MDSAVKYYKNSPGSFQQRCMYLWHRRFNDNTQKMILESRNASIVTYVTKHKAPFGSRDTIVEQTIMKVPLRIENSYIHDFTVLAHTLEVFKPDEFEIVFEDDTYPNEEAVLAMWWHSRRLPTTQPSADPSTTTPCIKVFEDDSLPLEKVRKEFGSKAVYVYGDGPWLVAGEPLTEEHAELLLGVK